MRLGTPFFVILALALAPTLYADKVVCQEPVEDWTYISDDFFRFDSSRTCTIQTVDLDTSFIFFKVLSVLQTNGTILSGKSTSGPDQMTGYQLDYKDNVYDSGWGKISILYDSSLLFNNGKVSYIANSKSFEADRYATSAKKVTLEVDYIIDGKSIHFQLKKSAEITIPDHAPTPYFLYLTQTVFHKEVIEVLNVFTNFF